MRTRFLGACTALLAVTPAGASVFINEVFINPPGSSADDTREYIELLGTPGKKLDGYALAFLSGGQQKLYPAGSIPPRPDANEVDEFFSLDGLSLGANGILVIGIGGSTAFYPTMLPDSNFTSWGTLWNGGLDTPGKLNNDGSGTLFLIRNRPGITQADPGNPLGLRWGKDINCDDELTVNSEDPSFVFFGDGGIDSGVGTNPDGQTVLDLRGKLTPDDVTDDLEIVDEVSFESDQGWEYDIDERRVDEGSLVTGLPPRRVHALDDPQGFNPDALTRVDYRTKGPGWTPAAGAVGQLPNGNNWQDTATEQWIRGDSVQGSGGQGSSPQWFYDNAANTNPDSIQPYNVNVPLWLNDGAAPDYNFAAGNTYQIMAGRINPLATPYIPGDADRDGIADAADVAKIAAVFGDANWIFSNSFGTAPEGDSGDPATQTRPWDVDATGDNGVEPSDLQWTLNFIGSANGQIVGRTYDSTTPAATGVYLNPNTGVSVTVSQSTFVPSGRPLTGLLVGDTVEVTIRGQVTSGANTLAGQQNGVMQFCHDVELLTGGVVEVSSVTPLGGFSTTRASLQNPQGINGDLGVDLVNGYSTSFTSGLGSASDLYRVTLTAVANGSTSLRVLPAAATRFAASTPHGVKVGHTASNGNPAGAAYPALLNLVVGGSSPCPEDCTGDGLRNQADLALLLSCYNAGPCCDVTGDGITNQADLAALLAVYNINCP